VEGDLMSGKLARYRRRVAGSRNSWRRFPGL
jgi:hypothetical protein